MRKIEGSPNDQETSHKAIDPNDISNLIGKLKKRSDALSRKLRRIKPGVNEESRAILLSDLDGITANIKSLQNAIIPDGSSPQTKNPQNQDPQGRAKPWTGQHTVPKGQSKG